MYFDNGRYYHVHVRPYPYIISPLPKLQSLSHITRVRNSFSLSFCNTAELPLHIQGIIIGCCILAVVLVVLFILIVTTSGYYYYKKNKVVIVKVKTCQLIPPCVVQHILECHTCILLWRMGVFQYSTRTVLKSIIFKYVCVDILSQGSFHAKISKYTYLSRSLTKIKKKTKILWGH